MEISGQLHAPALLPPRKSLWYPLDRRLGGPQRWFGRGGEEKNSQTVPGLEPPIIQPVAQHLYHSSIPVNLLSASTFSDAEYISARETHFLNPVR
jgi:hypothetical protein